MKNLAGYILAAALSVSAVASQAATLFDGSTLASANTTRSAGDGPLGKFTFSDVVTLTSISQIMDPNASGSVKFVIFEDTALVFEGAAQTFIDSGAGNMTMTSAPLSFVAKKDTTYFIGGFMNVGGRYGYGIGNRTQGVVTAISENANVRNFAAPSLRSGGSAVIAVSLDGSAGNTPAVPLPAAAPLLLGGLGLVGLLRARRRAA